MIKLRFLLQKTFKDKEGSIVIGQFPNLPLFGWILLQIVALNIHKGHARTAFQDLAMASLFTWSYLEITDGANYFRKLLGFVIMIVVVVSYFTG
ncbi:MAG TPA: hypothetical protein VNE40_00930 [Candidatus Dormibacteraeota bacterium]|nr:hypothetical protein [Candidatus Dormibacteraeota bacterium]